MSGGTSSGSGSIAGGGTSLNAITTAVDTLDWPRVEKAWPAPAEWVLETLRLQKHNTCVYMCCPEIRHATPPFALQRSRHFRRAASRLLVVWAAWACCRDPGRYYDRLRVGVRVYPNPTLSQPCGVCVDAGLFALHPEQQSRDEPWGF